MADVLRGALAVNRREPPPQTAVLFVAGSLLLTTLAPVILEPPIGECCVSVQSLRKAPYLNGDTSRGMPKTLMVEVTPPIGVESFPQFQQHSRKEFLPANTSAGSPKTLRLEVNPPQGKASLPLQVQAKSGDLWLPADTTQGMPESYRAPVIPPLYNLPYPTPDKRRWLPADTSQEMAKTLTADAQAPVGADQTYTQPDRTRFVLDTSQESAVIYLPIPATPLPPGVEQTASAPYPKSPVWDTTRGTPKTLTEESLPVGGQWVESAPPPNLVVVNTSDQTPFGIRTFVALPLPIGQQVYIGPAYYPAIKSETTLGTPIGLEIDSQPIPPVVLPPDSPGPAVGGGGGKHLDPDDLETFKRLRKWLKKGKSLQEAVALLEKDPDLEPKVEAIVKKHTEHNEIRWAQMRKDVQAVNWIARQLKDKEEELDRLRKIEDDDDDDLLLIASLW